MTRVHDDDGVVPDSPCREATVTTGRLDAIYRRTGANMPNGDPLPSHGLG